MKFIKSFSLILFFSSFYLISAQEVTKKDTINGTPLSVTMDNSVLDLIDDLEDKCSRVAAAPDFSTPKNNSGTVTPSTPRVNTPSRPLSTAEVCRQNPRILGYKIQLTVVKSNAEANEVKAYFRRRFPTIKVEVDASLRPNYKVLAGSYFTKQSASSDLAKIKAYFKSAMPVPYRVFCVEAK